MKNTLESFPNTLSPDFIPRALKRLLPDPAGLDRSGLLNFFREKGRLEQLILDNPLPFFEPNDGGQFGFMTCDDPVIQGRYFFAGNKSGKTTGALIAMIEHAVGRALWGVPKREGLRWRTPTRGAIFAEDFDTHREDTLPRLFTWCPRSELAETPLENGSTGNPARVNFKNGTVAYLRTYEQGYAKAEGKDYDWVFCNEPPTRDIYTAIWRGFMATHGIMWIAATLLSQTWLAEESKQSFVKIFKASTYENKWLSQSGMRNFESMLDQSEHNIRFLGIPSSLSGKIYPKFTDSAPWVIQDQNPPWDVVKEQPWPIIMAVDPHERRGLYVEWAYVSPTNRIVWFDWSIIPTGETSLDKTFELLKEKEQSHNHPSCLTIMDPNRGVAVQLGGHSWEQEFQEHDYPVELGNDDVSFGHAQVRDMLYGTNPQMVWMEKCLGSGGPVWQMQHYVYAERKRGSYLEHEQREKPADINKDFPDLHRYVALAKLDYALLKSQDGGILTLDGRSSTKRGNAYFPGGVATRALTAWK